MHLVAVARGAALWYWTSAMWTRAGCRHSSPHLYTAHQQSIEEALGATDQMYLMVEDYDDAQLTTRVCDEYARKASPGVKKLRCEAWSDPLVSFSF
jgi:hypothetical protein